MQALVLSQADMLWRDRRVRMQHSRTHHENLLN